MRIETSLLLIVFYLIFSRDLVNGASYQNIEDLYCDSFFQHKINFETLRDLKSLTADDREHEADEDCERALTIHSDQKEDFQVFLEDFNSWKLEEDPKDQEIVPLENLDKNAFKTPSKLSSDLLNTFSPFGLTPPSENFSVKNNFAKMLSHDCLNANKETIVWVLYFKYHEEKKAPYVGRTRCKGSPIEGTNLPDGVKKREGNHEQNNKGFTKTKVIFATTKYKWIRFLEQWFIDFWGGSKSDGGTSSNAIRGIGNKNPKATEYKKIGMKRADFLKNFSHKEYKWESKGDTSSLEKRKLPEPHAELEDDFFRLGSGSSPKKSCFKFAFNPELSQPTNLLSQFNEIEA